MKKSIYWKCYLLVFFFISLLLDGQITRLLERWLQDYYIATAHLLLLMLLSGGKFLPKNFMLLCSLFLGCLYDLYYIGVIGVYAVGLPLIVWIMYLLRKTLYQNIFTMFFGMIILLTFLELVTLGIQLLFKLAVVDSTFFVTRFLGPTLLLNIFLFILLIYPIDKIMKKFTTKLNLK